MAQKKRDLAVHYSKAVVNCLPHEDEQDDTITAEGMALVRERAVRMLAERTFRSMNDARRIVKVG